MDNIVKEIKELIKIKSISASDCFWLVVSIHITLLLSKQRVDFITIILNKIPNSNLYLDILFSVSVIFAFIKYVMRYNMTLKYLEVETKTDLNLESKEYEEQFKKNYFKEYLKTLYFIIIAYFISLFKFYDPKYIIFYVIIFSLYKLLEKYMDKMLNLKKFIKSTFNFIFKH
ncbi:MULTISPECIES: hypothetical protein [Porcipelethomonas]|uniref:hypothetical protein n=1 Tax=Porcipelethomonas TaxID=2981643 RepID=UPI000822A074|nr:hypothetical protein [Porcipelethomonas ammoniilytica]MCU6720812.1 hypothetical protein [Porcipelethomonas ammoniilytica]SCJ26225.1 Uncharacterised protein [uncultured Ruminococcus sp.]